MPFENEVYPAVAHAADAIDRKRMNDASAHNCAGAHCAICSWRTSDIAEISRTIERELHLFAIVLFLRKLESLRTEAETAVQSGTGHLLALGEKNRLEGITVRTALFDEARLLLGTILGQQCKETKDQHNIAACFVLRPLVLPGEAHSGCEKCSYGAIMAKETATATTYLCYLHVVEAVLEEEVRGRTQ